MKIKIITKSKIILTITILISTIFSITKTEQDVNNLQINLGKKRFKVGLLVVATGRYINFVEPLINSAKKHFLTNHDVTYFIFTEGQPPKADNIIKIQQNRLGWPYDTMMRYEMYYKAKDLLKDMDYLFASDADMLFVDTVGDEILSDRVATLHPLQFGNTGSYDRNKNSTACINNGDGKNYFAGGFNGGSTKEFLRLADTITKNIYIDLGKNIIALWHDESHINRYYVDNEPTKILSSSYCYPEGLNLPYQQKLLALNKNHAEMRK